MKSTILHTGILLGVSVATALIYNAFTEKPLDLVREPIVLSSASDSALFADAPASAPASPAAVDTASVRTAELASSKDTAKPAVAADNTLQLAINPTTKEAPAEAEKLEAKNVTYEQVVRLSKDPSVVFIDARNADDYGQGHIGNARNYFTHDFEKHIPEIVQIDREKRIVVYCGGGACELSHELAEHLLNFGFKRVFVYTGGWEEWKKKQGVH